MKLIIRNASRPTEWVHAALTAERFAREFPVAERGTGRASTVVYTFANGAPHVCWYTAAGSMVVYIQCEDD